MTSFEAKIGWKRSITREREKIKFQKLPFLFVPTRRVIQNSKKIAKKIQKIKKKKKQYVFISSQNMLENTEKERK